MVDGMVRGTSWVGSMRFTNSDGNLGTLNLSTSAWTRDIIHRLVTDPIVEIFSLP